MVAEGMTRPTPWGVLFAGLESRYAALDEADDLTTFSKHPEVQQLLDTIQAPALIEQQPIAAAEYLHLLFADWQHWHAGRPLGGDGPAYLAVEPRRYWMQPDPEGPHEPLDGCYVIPLPRDALLVVAILGLHEGRAGVSQVTLTVPAAALAAAEAELPDDPFAPAMPGGAAAGFKSVRTAAELLHLVRVARDGTGS